MSQPEGGILARLEKELALKGESENRKPGSQIDPRIKLRSNSGSLGARHFYHLLAANARRRSERTFGLASSPQKRTDD
jgi:hypothetical protein